MKNVALIDDDPAFAVCFARQLEKHSLWIKHFDTLDQFLTEKSAGSFDAVLVDLDMEDSSGTSWEFAGLDCVQAIRRAGQTSVPVGVLTGNANPYLANASSQNGADGFFHKDMPTEKLASEVHNLMTQGRGAQL